MAKPLSDLLGRVQRTSISRADSRVKLVRAVRAAAARMGLRDDDRHAIQVEVTGKASLADMTPAEIGKVLDRLNRDRPAPMAHRAHIGKIRALWWSAYWLGLVDAPGDAALDAFVRRQTGLSSLRFLDHGKAPAVIEALRAMLARGGVLWRIAADLPEGVDQPTGDRLAVLEAIWDGLRQRGIVRGTLAHYVAELLRGKPDPWGWSAHEYDIAIRQLGKRLRRALDKPVAE